MILVHHALPSQTLLSSELVPMSAQMCRICVRPHHRPFSLDYFTVRKQLYHANYVRDIRIHILFRILKQ